MISAGYQRPSSGQRRNTSSPGKSLMSFFSIKRKTYFCGAEDSVRSAVQKILGSLEI